MVDNNEYAPNLDAIDVPPPGGTYVFGSKADMTDSNADNKFDLKNSTGTADKSRFYIYASAKKKLAGCASNSTAPFDVWCLDYEKHMSNDNTQKGECKAGTAAAEKLVKGGC